MKNFFNVILVVVAFAAIVLLLNKCDLKDIIKSDETPRAKSTVKNIPDDAPIVLIDAGHGFKDPGCESKYLSSKESDLTLIMAKLLKEELENKKIRAILTHDGKTFPSCKKIINEAKKYSISYDNGRLQENEVFSAYERAVYANIINAKTPVDLFVSVHVNSIENNEDISQYEIYYHKQSPYTEELNVLSSSISARLDNYTKISALNSEDAYTVTRYTDFPSLLLETGYATNKNDAKRLNSAKWRKEFCETIAEEIENFVSK